LFYFLSELRTWGGKFMFIAKVDGTNTLLYLLIEWDADFVDDWFKFVAGFWEVDKVCRVFIKTYGG